MYKYNIIFFKFIKKKDTFEVTYVNREGGGWQRLLRCLGKQHKFIYI